MPEPYIYSLTHHVATFSINDEPYNLMSLDYIDRLEEQLPEVLADDNVRALVFTAAGLDHFSAGMNLKQLPEGVQRAGSPEAFFDQRHRVMDMIENGGKPAIATLFGFCLGGGLELPLARHFRIAADQGAQIGLPEMDLGSVPPGVVPRGCRGWSDKTMRWISRWKACAHSSRNVNRCSISQPESGTRLRGVA